MRDPISDIQEMCSDIAEQELYTTTIPPLCHYTSGEGLHGILGSGYLRASNFSFMNDTSEFTYGLNLMRELATNELTQSMPRARHRLYELLFHVWAVGIGDVDLYLTCFCKKGDLLSQWRGYGSEASRYCIEFEGGRLEPVNSGAPSPIMPVVYDAARQRRLLTLILSRHTERLKELDTVSEKMERVLLNLACCVYYCCLPVLAFFKDSSFEEEREWRSVLIARPDEHATLLEFSLSGGMVKPSLPLLSGADGRLSIRKIIAGAATAPALAVKAARLLLARYQYAEVEVVASKVPLSG